MGETVLGKKTVGMTGSERLPKVIVFDLDGTLWYPEMYMLWGGGAPFKNHSTRKDALVDRKGEKVELMGNSFDLMKMLLTDERYTSGEVAFGVASTCDEPDWAKECMKKFCITSGANEGGRRDMTDLFQFIEIYKAYTKQDHFRAIQKKAKAFFGHEVPFQEMIFFDNQRDNTHDVAKLGVHSVYTPDGMTEDHWRNGIQQWRSKSHV